MTEVVLSPNHIVQMHTEGSEDSDSSTDDVFLELAHAWGYVKKWYNFKNRHDGGTIDAAIPRATFRKNGHGITDEPQPPKITFQELPINIQIKIMSFLDVHSLSRASMVNRQWNTLANDGVLWDTKLRIDVHKWQVIDHLTHPQLYKETMTDLSTREMYLNCCPECRYKRRSSFKLSIPRISFYLGFSIPKVVMFGPGLESETSAIVKKIFSGPNSPFVVKGMFPGQFDGIGSGVSLQYDGGQLNLITLYSASRHERELNATNGVRRNKFIVERKDIDAEENGEAGSDSVITVTQPVKNLCATVDAFIYVVDSTFESNKVNVGIDELRAVVNDRWLQRRAPLLVLSCTTDASKKQHSSISVADTLGLRELNRPWQVRACHVNSLYGLLPGVKWLVHEVMKA